MVEKHTIVIQQINCKQRNTICGLFAGGHFTGGLFTGRTTSTFSSWKATMHAYIHKITVGDGNNYIHLIPIGRRFLELHILLIILVWVYHFAGHLIYLGNRHAAWMRRVSNYTLIS